ncbi:MAG: DUF488 family protein [Firmicutes bacterium]|nr:DUF488 family protein [Bacillota bacterium]
MGDLKIKRIYEPADPEDGYRLLADRLWPRGLSRKQAQIDCWAREIAPSTGLRRAFHQNSLSPEAFQQRYLAELGQNQEASAFLSEIRKKLKDTNVTLLYAVKEIERSHAPILKRWIGAEGDG